MNTKTEILNITCGDIANDYYLKKYNNEIFVPFNEAMCEGNPEDDIFSEKFILERIKTHKITKYEYLCKLGPFLNYAEKIGQYEIICWFGKDEFCQKNLLTLLAYLEQLNYPRDITFHLIDEQTFNIIRTNKISVKGYKEKYLKEIRNVREDL